MLKFIRSIKIMHEKVELLMRKTQELDRRIKRLELEEFELSENAIEQPPAQHYTVDVTAEVDTEKAVGQTEELIALLKKANSLTDELAVILSNLKLDIKL